MAEGLRVAGVLTIFSTESKSSAFNYCGIGEERNVLFGCVSDRPSIL